MVLLRRSVVGFVICLAVLIAWRIEAVLGTPAPSSAEQERLQQTRALLQRIDTLEARSAAQVPIGSIVAFGGQTPPAGWRLCNGDVLSAAEFPELFLAIGNTFGSGPAEHLFMLPDLRGRFLRGVDNGAGRDPDKIHRTAMHKGGNEGDLVGSIQEDQFAGHTHEFDKAELSSNAGIIGTQERLIGPKLDLRSRREYTRGAGGNETRPMNAYVHWIMRVK